MTMTVHYYNVGENVLNQTEFENYVDYMEWKHYNKGKITIYMVQEVK
jgi:hypothetical protein